MILNPARSQSPSQIDHTITVLVTYLDETQQIQLFYSTLTFDLYRNFFYLKSSYNNFHHFILKRNQLISNTRVKH